MFSILLYFIVVAFDAFFAVLHFLWIYVFAGFSDPYRTAPMEPVHCTTTLVLCVSARVPDDLIPSVLVSLYFICNFCNSCVLIESITILITMTTRL